jgi:serine/threonine protein kinase
MCSRPGTKYIAEGSFGKVSSACLQNGSEVAIKEIKQHEYEEVYTEDVMLTRVWNEAANCIKLKGNPRFVELLGIYINDINNPCFSMAMVMEYADGDLKAYKNAIADNKEVKLSYGNIRYLALEIFSIIEACKQVKIDYMDFHLGNILVFNVAKKLKLGDLDKIETFVNCSSMIYQSSFELLKLSCTNYGKSRRELIDVRTNFTYNIEECKNKLSEFLGGDNILTDIILEPLVAYKEIRKIETNVLENMIEQIQSCELEPFPTLAMI